MVDGGFGGRGAAVFGVGVARVTDATLHGVFDGLTGSDLRVQILVFFHRNPGLVETAEGLARRMGANVAALRREIRPHVELGLVRERAIGSMVVLQFDRARQAEIEGSIERMLAARLRGHAA